MERCWNREFETAALIYLPFIIHRAFQMNRVLSHTVEQELFAFQDSDFMSVETVCMVLPITKLTLIMGSYLEVLRLIFVYVL